MKLLLILAFIVVSALMLVLLIISNGKKENRWKQLFNMPLLLLIDIIAIFAYGKIQWLADIILPRTPFDSFVSVDYYIAFFLVVILSSLVFVILKPLIRFLTPLLKLFPFYRLDNEEKKLYYLKDNYIFLNMVLKFLAIAILVLFVLSFVLYYFIPNISPFYIIMVSFLLLEAYWYFNGNVFDEDDNYDEDTPVDDIFEKNDVEFEKIYNFFIGNTLMSDGNKLISYQKIRNKKPEKETGKKGKPANNKTINKKKTEGESFDNGDVVLKMGNYSLIPDGAITMMRNLILGGRHILLVGPYWNIVSLNIQNQDEYSPYYIELGNFFKNEVLGEMDIFDGISNIQFFSSKHPTERFTKSIIISSAFDILFDSNIIKNNLSWFSKLDLVVFENISENFVLNRSTQATLSHVLRSIKKNINYWFLNSETQNLEPAIRSEFFHDADIVEKSFMGQKDNLAYYLCWRTEENTLQNIFELPINQHIGINYVVSHKANELVKHKDFVFITDNNEPKNDYREALLGLYPGQGTETPVFSHTLNQFVLDKEKPFYLIDDYNHNVSSLVSRLKTSKSKTVLYSTSSKPYLFRDYMLGNLMYFSKHILLPLSPKIDVTDMRNKLVVLFETLKYRSLPKEEIKELFKLKKDADDINFSGYLCKLYKDYFESDIAPVLKVKISKDPLKQWKPEICYYINGNENINGHLVNFDINENERDRIFFGKIQRDFVFQYFLSKPYFAYNQKYFKITDGGINIEDRKISLEHLQEDTTNRWHTSRAVYEINVNGIGIIKDPDNMNGIDYIQDPSVKIDVSLKILGRYDFLGNIPFDYYRATYINASNFTNLLSDRSAFETISERNYTDKNSLYYSIDISSFIKDTDDRKLAISKISHTLVFLIQQALVTFLPDSHEFVKVISLNINDQGFKDQKLVHIVNVSGGIDMDNEWIQILFVEDAISDLGLLKSIEEYLPEKILPYIDDYLHWYIFSNEEVNSSQVFNKPLDIEVEEGNIEGPGNTGPFLNVSQPFLRCVNNSHPDFLDIKNTKMILSKILGDNEITKVRLGYLNNVEDITEDGDDVDHECDFCGSTHKRKDMHVIKADGREGCPVCKEEMIDEEAEVNNFINNDVQVFFSIFGLKMPKENVKARFTNTIEIQKRFGKTFRPTRFFDKRVLGFASPSENLIQIENMMPRKMYILTTIHEWVHIWQYWNLDFVKMRKQDNLIVEGHTTWCEIFYAKHAWNEDHKNRLAPDTRNDDYGNGYRLMVELLEKHKKFDDDPFKMLLEFYPR